MVEGCGAQRGPGAEGIGAEYVGATVSTKQVDGGTGIGVIDKEVVGVLAMSIVVDEYGETEKKEGKEEESEPSRRTELFATVGDVERGSK